MNSGKSVKHIIVIGGGVVGCAIFRRFCLSGADCLLLEKGSDILSGASKANSAILHTGFDAPPGSLELHCMQAGYQEYLDIKDKMHLPLLPAGGLVVAWDESQFNALPGIVNQAHKNGVSGVCQMESKQIYQREPNLAKGAFGAVYVPGESIIDPWSSPLAYMTQGVKHGGQYHFNTEIIGVDFYHNIWRVKTTKGDFYATLVINCAGIYGDVVEGFCRQPDFRIQPRKGQFLVYDKIAAEQINSIILPVPTSVTKGVLLSKTIFGNLLLGPTAEEQADRLHAEINEEVMKDLINRGLRILPSLKNYSITAAFAGLRPATEEKDYRISHVPEKPWICVAGIRSTGLTAALGIAQYVEYIWRENYPDLFKVTSPKTVKWPKMPLLSEYSIHGDRDFKKPGNGGIVCHCERVTEREIMATFDSDIPPECLAGLRRRTRAMMGRCNGFFCGHRITEMMANELRSKERH